MSRRRRRTRRRSSLFATGEPMIWLTGGALVICLAMILGLLWIVASRGFATFWPSPLVQVTTYDGTTHLGEVTEEETFRLPVADLEALPESVRERAEREMRANEGQVRRRQLRTGNFELTGEHFNWVRDHEIVEESRPPWAILVERLQGGRFQGTPRAFRIGEEVVATEPADAWSAFERHHEAVRERWEHGKEIEEEIGEAHRRIEAARLDLKAAEIDGDPAAIAEAREAFEQTTEAMTQRMQDLGGRLQEVREENAAYVIAFETASGASKDVPVEEVVRAYPANRLDLGDKIAIYLARWGEFLTAEPREANSEGGVWPAIFGTVLMTLLMSLMVVPFGVIAALYLREYAKPGPVVSTVRIAINNLAGVPSIVFGVFGLGFFCYFLGVRIDALFFPEYAPNPKYGKGGILWASLTLALLTLPVVIVATEEALAAVPGSMREGSYACGASKWQTIKRIVLPRAMPGIMTGMILAVARGAGEVAPLMLVGAAKYTPELPVSDVAPYVHPDRSFMHLGFHIYDLGFQSQNSEAAKPMVFSTTLLLITIVVVLNTLGMVIRSRLRRKFKVGT